MARYDIIHNGSVVYSGKPSYHGIFGKVSYLEFAEIASPTLLELSVGDYVVYDRTGLTYRLYSAPRPERKASTDKDGNSFVYKNVQFLAATKDLELAPFRDLVLNDNTIHFTTLAQVSTYEDVYGIVDRIQANLNSIYGSSAWVVRVVETEDATLLALFNEVKEFTLSDGTCMDALGKIAELWNGLGWVHIVEEGKNTIVIGRPNIQDAGNTTDVFSYGKGNGLRAVAQSDSANADIATRVYAYGSDRNIPARYYNTYSPAIKDAESVYIPNLMIPVSRWGMTNMQRDPSKAHIDADSASMAQLGLRPRILRFDGSDSVYPDIYPSVEGMTAGQLRAAGESITYPPSSRYADSFAVNQILSAANPSDNGVTTTDGSKYLEQHSINVPARTGQNFILPDATISTISFGGAIATTTTQYAGKLIITPFSASISGVPAIKGKKCTLSARVSGVTYSASVPCTYDRAQGTISAETPKTAFEVAGFGTVEVFLSVTLEVAPSQNAYTLLWDVAATQVDVLIQNTIGSTFKVTIPQIGFDISEMGSSISNGLGTLSMKTGNCAGRSFVIQECTYIEDTDAWELSLLRQEDSSLGQSFPNSIYPIATGDAFVILDIQMPPAYVEAASQRLHDAASSALSYLKTPKVTYTPEIDAKVVALSGETLIEGMYMPVYDEDIIPTEIPTIPNTAWILIDSLTITEGESNIPTYKVTLRDQKPQNYLEIISGESAANAQRLAELEAQGKLRPASESELPEGEDEPMVEIIATPNPYFLYPDPASTPAEGVTLTALTQGIVNPSYQWYCLGESAWEVITGATGQSYEVDPNSTQYFQNGDLAENFRVVVSGTYSAEILVAKLLGGADGITIMLNNSSHIFPAGTSAALGGSDTVSVIAFKGTTRVATTVGTITGQITGKLTALVSDNQTTSTSITITATTSLDIASGVLTIPVTAEGATINLQYSWALAFKGSTGAHGTSVSEISIYKRSTSGAPSDTPDECTYTFSSDSLTPKGSGSMNGWSRDIPASAAFSPVYVRKAKASSTSDTDTILTTDWSTAVRLTGDNGLAGKVMRGINEFNPYGIGGTASQPGEPYQGLDDTITSHIYYDMVFVGTTPSTRVFYYCKVYQKNGVPAQSITPGTDSDVWVLAAYYDFIASRVLLAENASIEFLSGQTIALKDTSGNVTTGMQGGGSSNSPVINIWAGSSNPNNAPFRVDSQGNVVANKVTQLSVSGAVPSELKSIIDIGTAQVPNEGIGRVKVESDGSGVSANGTVTIESVIGSVRGATIKLSGTSATIARGSLASATAEDILSSADIAHIDVLTQAEYDAITTPDPQTLYVIKSS